MRNSRVSNPVQPDLKRVYVGTGRPLTVFYYKNILMEQLGARQLSVQFS